MNQNMPTTMIHVPLTVLFTEGSRTQEILDTYSCILKLLLSSPQKQSWQLWFTKASHLISRSIPIPGCTNLYPSLQRQPGLGGKQLLNMSGPQLRAEDCLCNKCYLWTYQRIHLSRLGRCLPGSFCKIFQTTNVTVKNNLNFLLLQICLRRRRSQQHYGLFSGPGTWRASSLVRAPYSTPPQQLCQVNTHCSPRIWVTSYFIQEAVLPNPLTKSFRWLPCVLPQCLALYYNDLITYLYYAKRS